MTPMGLFHTLVYEPLYNTLIAFYTLVPGEDFGVAIIFTTLLIKFLFIPLSRKQIVAQKKMQEIQPELKALQAKHKDDKEKQTRALMEFYKKNKINPLAGCLPLIVQFIFLLAMYRVIINVSEAGFIVNPADLYSFIANPGAIQHYFLGLVDLTAKNNYILAFLSAAAQYYQMKMLIANQPAPAQAASGDRPDFAAIMNKQMLYMAPALAFFFGTLFPAALALYWLVSTLFMIGQQLLIFQAQQKKEA